MLVAGAGGAEINPTNTLREGSTWHPYGWDYVNELLTSLNVPLRLTDGFVGEITIG
ncbi:hypothetical protein KIN20_012823 [Parelaphostrongylus tenuis]|uniref:Uncharacterized protein n=1 Tax=Parelaphostrongylus tenuis TaxID=148309 RepID=A0AAD5MWQ8_PARTN|nr:hypothetical protein KIN20_012823 [Parelaphostrongylus tenuis]